MKTDETQPAVDYSTLSIAGLSRHIRQDWAKMYFGARPYLDAMLSLQSVDDPYGCDSGRDIIRYFLCNATTWRGPIARAIKAELNKRLK